MSDLRDFQVYREALICLGPTLLNTGCLGNDTEASVGITPTEFDFCVFKEGMMNLSTNSEQESLNNFLVSSPYHPLRSTGRATGLPLSQDLVYILASFISVLLVSFLVTRTQYPTPQPKGEF